MGSCFRDGRRLAWLACVLLAGCEQGGVGMDWQPGTASGAGGMPGPVAGTGGVTPGMMPPLPGTGGVTDDGGGGIVGAGGAGGAGGIAGTGGSVGGGTGGGGALPADLDTCAQPPAGATPQAVQAWTIVNEIRLAAGAGCMDMVPELNASAQLHCEYNTRHRGTGCYVDAHTEVSGCEGFRGANVQAREIAAGYPRELAYTEVALTYGNDPERAIPGWLVTPFHRIPLLDPWTTDMGWGGTSDCDIIDVGRGTAVVPDDTILVYPYPGQNEVPPTFNGLEAPAPPEPAGGWPSAYPISIYARQLSVTEHVVMKEGTDAPLSHTWLDTNNPGNAGLRPYFTNTAIMYGAPFEPQTTYRVRLAGTHAGGAFEREWTFETGAAQPGWF